MLPSTDALQEFKVQTGVYPAEFGYNATQINVLTKSGGNQYHGALFRFEGFKILNPPVWGAPNSNKFRPGSATVSGAAVAMRQPQFAFKYLF